MSNAEYASTFFDYFKGNTTCYVEHNYSVVPVNKKKTKVKSEVFFKKQEVTEDLFLSHLSGRKGLGICPINTDSKCYYGVIDIDVYNVSFRGLIEMIYDHGLPLLPFRSKSGGLHLYFFVKSAVAAKSMISALEDVVSIFGMEKTYFVEGAEKVEIFPKQKVWSPGKQGSCITVPYFGKEDTAQYLYDRDMNPVGIEDALTFIKKSRSSVSTLSDALGELDYADAPKCIQTIALSRCLGKDSGRNNYLFTAAVYLKKKYKDKFGPYVEELNMKLAEPVNADELGSIIVSVTDNEFNYKCKDIPCKTYCDSSECSKREYGVGREKGGHFTGLDYGKIIRMMSDDPYYIWELKHKDDTGEYKKIIIRSASVLLDQRQFAVLMVDKMNYAPTPISDLEWRIIINKVLLSVEEVEVTKSSDTSDSAEIKNTFLQYLVKRKSTNNAPFQIKMGLVYTRDGKYYFMHVGFQEYLETKKLKMVSSTLREVLLSFGAVEDTLVYTNKQQKEIRVDCWSKTEDDGTTGVKEFYEDVYVGDQELIEEDFKNAPKEEAPSIEELPETEEQF